MAKEVFHFGRFKALVFFAGLALFMACKTKPEESPPGAGPNLDAAALKATSDLRVAAEPASLPAPQAETKPEEESPSFSDSALAELAWKIPPGCRLESVDGNAIPEGNLGMLIHTHCDTLQGLAERFSGTWDTVSNKDSIKCAWHGLQDSTFNLIQGYEKQLAAAKGLPDLRPNLLRDEKVEDSLSKAKLPKVGPSAFLAEHPFFFLGAGPFLLPPSDRDKADFRDLRGNPELRYCDDLNRNTSLVMDMLISISDIPVKTKEGPGIPPDRYRYFLGESVKGIGSLTHVLEKDFPVYFITEQGLLPARLAQVTDALYKQDACTSNLPSVCFGTPALPKKEILGVFITYEPIDLMNCKVARKRHLWTVDLTGDGVPEIAGVSSDYESVGGTINEVYWYGNVSGTWQLIDYGKDLDCS